MKTGFEKGADASEEVFKNWGIEMKIGEVNTIGVYKSDDVAHVIQILAKVRVENEEDLVIGIVGAQLIKGRIGYLYLYQSIDGNYTVTDLSKLLYDALKRMSIANRN